jgi:hypothetical protein
MFGTQAGVHAQLLATTSGAGNLGLVVLMLMLGAGIFVSLRHKKTTITELLIIGMFGLCLGATSVGALFGSGVSSAMGSLLGALQ